jgi:hypothetical protein
VARTFSRILEKVDCTYAITHFIPHRSTTSNGRTATESTPLNSSAEIVRPTIFQSLGATPRKIRCGSSRPSALLTLSESSPLALNRRRVSQLTADHRATQIGVRHLFREVENFDPQAVAKESELDQFTEADHVEIFNNRAKSQRAVLPCSSDERVAWRVSLRTAELPTASDTGSADLLSPILCSPADR